jgi:dihydrofolate reductase
MQYFIIVAVSENGVIGKDNQLIWRLSADLKRFKALTTGHTVVMGRKTFESIGRALPNRRNVVLSSSMENGAVEGVEVFSSIEALEKSLSADEEVFIIGGGEIYRQFLPYASKLYLTKVHVSIEGDVYFPAINESEWKSVFEESHVADEKNEYDYTFVDFERI